MGKPISQYSTGQWQKFKAWYSRVKIVDRWDGEMGRWGDGEK
ncbi:hypothetical protein [Limnofasciculus baicalensis]|nr:hypothetical protein [Limnofasciculus baicalensis]